MQKTLPARWYFDDALFQAEREAIFSRNWTCIAHERQLARAGDHITANIAGQDIVVVRNRQERLKGFVNACRHRAAPVCDPSQIETRNTASFVCPYHAWTYDLDGVLIAAPGYAGRSGDFDMSQYGLLRVRVDTWHGLIFATLAQDGAGLEEWMGDINDIALRFPTARQLEFAARQVNHCAANWKTYSDNSAEGYHLSMVHPELNDSLVAGKTRISCFEKGKFVGFEVTHADSAGDQPGVWVYKYPGLLLHFSGRSFNVERVIPQTPRQTRLERWFWFREDVADSARHEALQFSSRVIEQDIDICAAVQRNLEGGGYDRGVLSDALEPGTAFFQRCLYKDLVDQYPHLQLI